MEGRDSPGRRASFIPWLLALWVVAVVFFYWIVVGCPGVPAMAELTVPVRDLMLEFFTAPFLG
jgi:hypothetical protein